MDLRPRELETVKEEGWHVVTCDWWNTPYSSVSWKFTEENSLEGKARRPWFHGSLFGECGASCSAETVPTRQRHVFVGPEGDLTLSTDLCGVRCALDAIAVYELDVRISSTELVHSRSDPVDISSKVDEDEISRGRERWNVYAEELTNWSTEAKAEAGLDHSANGNETSRVSSPSSSHGGLHRSTSTLSSVDLTDSDLSFNSVSLPSTPKRKSPEAIVDIKVASPVKGGDGHFTSSPPRPLNASATSFVPSSLTPLNAKAEPFSFVTPTAAKSEPSPKPVFVNFTFPSLEVLPLPMTKIKKDDQGFYSEAEVAAPVPQSQGAPCTFLPPFLQDSPRRKAPASKTRAMVDRLRSSHNHSHSPIPNPPLYDMNVLDERISVSEDDRTRNSGMSTPSSQDEDDDGWINLAEADKASKESKARRTRNLFLALTRRRSDSVPPIHSGEVNVDGHADLEIPVTASPSSSLSPLPSADDGWIEGPSARPSTDATTRRRRTDSRSRSHRKRRSSHAPPGLPANLPPQFMPPTTLPNPVGLPHVPFHPATPHFPSQTSGSYFYATYPPMVSPVAYTSYMQQLQFMQMQMHNNGGGGGRQSTAPHPAEWFQYPPPGAQPFTTSNPPITTVPPALGVQRDSLW